jgi:hypothetical protein
MTRKGKTLEPKLGLDIPFEEALDRFLHTKPSEVEASIEKSKQKKPRTVKKKKPGSKHEPPGNASQSPKVIALRDKRKR